MRIYDSLKQMLIPELILKASGVLHEDEPKMVKAVHMIFPSMLGGLLKTGATPEVAKAIDDAGRLQVAAHLEDIFGGHGVKDHMNVGERFENAVLGAKTAKFRDMVATHSGLKPANADRFTNWICATIAAYFGNEIFHHNETLEGLMGRLSKEKGDFASHISAGVSSLLGLGAIVGTHHATHKTTPAHPTAKHEPEKKKGGWGWLVWLLVILAVLFLLFYWWRCCDRKKEAAVPAAVEHVVAQPVVESKWHDLTLPNGVRINVLRGSLEDQLVGFLNSDEYKNATEAQLKDRWFHIETIEFKFGSSTELVPGSDKHLKNFEQILKAYPTMKLRLAGYADKVGSDAANMKLSEARANFIRTQMEKAGVKDQITTQGFGEHYAKFPADASEELRSRDRDIALRFVK